MKKIGLVFSLVLFFLSSIQVNAQWAVWESLNPFPTSEDLLGVQFIDQNIGWVVGYSGNIFKSSNGGNSWIQQSSNTESYLTAASFIDTSRGWITGSGGTILKTTDGGDNWILQNSNLDYDLNSVHFFDNENGLAVGGNYSEQYGIILTTNDGGNSWIPLNIQLNDILFDVFFVNDSVGWIVGGQIPIILKTTNGGKDWFLQASPQVWLLLSVFFLDENNGWITSSWGEVLKTTDGGTTWVKKTVQEGVALNDVHFINEYVGFAGATIFMKITTDGGNYWYDNGHPYGKINSFCFINPQVGWAVGSQGRIFRTTNGGVTFIEEENNSSQPKQFLLQQNYPNPFNPSTKISWQSPVSSWQTLRVYDILGNEVATLVDEYRNAGSYEVDFKSLVSSPQLANGVYFYQLRVGDYIETKKMILLK